MLIQRENKMEIWKFELLSGSIEVPYGAKLLSCQWQGVKLCAWMIVDPFETRREIKEYKLVDTGHPFDPNGLEYFATMQDELMLVRHLFWVKR